MVITKNRMIVAGLVALAILVIVPIVLVATAGA
jgi:hypothetical protein